MKTLLFTLSILIYTSSYSQKKHVLYSTQSDSVKTDFECLMYNCYTAHCDTNYYLTFSPDDTNQYFIYSSKKPIILYKREFNSDTLFETQYHGNGKIKSLNKHYLGTWIYSIKYHINGQLEFLIPDFNDTLHLRTVYYDNGQLEWKALSHRGHLFGTEYRYYYKGEISEITEHEPYIDSIHKNIAFFYKSPPTTSKYFTIDGKPSTWDRLESRNINMQYIPMMPNKQYPIGDSIYFYTTFDGQQGYNLVMSELSNKIESYIKIPKKCKCKCTYTYATLRVHPDGHIEILDIAVANPCVKKSLEKAIKKVGKWITFKYDKKIYIDIMVDILYENYG